MIVTTTTWNSYYVGEDIHAAGLQEEISHETSRTWPTAQHIISNSNRDALRNSAPRSTKLPQFKPACRFARIKWKHAWGRPVVPDSPWRHTNKFIMDICLCALSKYTVCYSWIFNGGTIKIRLRPQLYQATIQKNTHHYSSASTIEAQSLLIWILLDFDGASRSLISRDSSPPAWWGYILYYM